MQGIPFVSEQLHEGELVHSLEVARWDSFQFEEGPQSRGQDAQRDALGHSRPDAGHHPHEPAGS